MLPCTGTGIHLIKEDNISQQCCVSGSVESVSFSWIRIHIIFAWIRICIKVCPGSGSITNIFPHPGFGSATLLTSCKKHKRLLKIKKQCSLKKCTLKKLNKFAVISNFLAFFQFSVEIFTLLDPDPHIECGSGSRRENECGSMRIRIHSPAYIIPVAYGLDPDPHGSGTFAWIRIQNS